MSSPQQSHPVRRENGRPPEPPAKGNIEPSRRSGEEGSEATARDGFRPEDWRPSDHPDSPMRIGSASSRPGG